jgi:uncharacterized membrane protein YesL
VLFQAKQNQKVFLGFKDDALSGCDQTNIYIGLGMILLALKKTFYDYWEQFLRYFFINFIFILLGAMIYLFPGIMLGFGELAFLLSFAFSILLFFVHLGGSTALSLAIAKIDKTETISYFKSYKSGLLPGLIFGVIQSLIFLAASFSIQYYLSLQDILASLAVGFIIWGLIIWNFVLFYLLQVKADLEESFWKSIKKSALLSFDNALFTLAIGLITILLTALTSVTAFLFPGVGGVILFVTNAYRFRMMKYDYLKSHTLQRGEKIPWNLILKDEEIRVKGRSITPPNFKL